MTPLACICQETACHTYVTVIKHIETPGTKLHEGWAMVGIRAINRRMNGRLLSQINQKFIECSLTTRIRRDPKLFFLDAVCHPICTCFRVHAVSHSDSCSHLYTKIPSSPHFCSLLHSDSRTAVGNRLLAPFRRRQVGRRIEMHRKCHKPKSDHLELPFLMSVACLLLRLYVLSLCLLFPCLFFCI